MIFKPAMTEVKKEELLLIPKEDFEKMEHKFDDYELDYDSFKQREKEVKEYLEVNKK